MKTALVVGATGGLGRAVAEELAHAGWRLVLACRDEHRGAFWAARIAERSDGPTPSVLRLDLADEASVRSVAARLARDGAGLDLVVHAAGQGPGSDAQEAWRVNVGGPFLLTWLLEDLLTARKPGRVVFVTRAPPRRGAEGSQDRLTLALAWARRWDGAGAAAHAYVPGPLRAGFWRHAAWPRRAAVWIGARSPLRAARDFSRLLESPEFLRSNGGCWRGRHECFVPPHLRSQAEQDAAWRRVAGRMEADVPRPSPHNP